MIRTTLSSAVCPAKTLSPERKKRLALQAITHQKTVSQLANENHTSRKFIRQQGENVQNAINNVFELSKPDNNNVLYTIPVTKTWITQCVLALMMVGHASYRNIIMIIKDLFDYTISEGTIHTIYKQSVVGARQVNAAENLSSIEVTANDELFHHNKPILSGIDTRSLYCYLLSLENHRDEDTWAIRLFDAQDKRLNPQRTIGDDAKGLVSGHKIVYPQTPYDYDNFHLTRSLMNVRRYFRNRLKSSITELNTLEIKHKKSSCDIKLAEQVFAQRKSVTDIRHLSTTLDTLISWLEHDILNKAGPALSERHELYDFVVDEFKKLEILESHRIMVMRITLENKKMQHSTLLMC